jgi:hypothetical protein
VLLGVVRLTGPLIGHPVTRSGAARLAAQGKGEQQIYEEVGARDLNQVMRVLSGKTYKRVS